MAGALKELGYYVAPQRPAELLLQDWYDRNFKSIIRFVKFNGQAFQDVPFSLPDTFKALDRAFPDSKFILTIRDDADQWYRSVTSFQAKLFGNGNLPVKADLLKAKYVYEGWMWMASRLIYNTPEDDIYNKEILLRHYDEYNKSVIEYFQDRQDKLLVINLKEQDVSRKLSLFLGAGKILEEMPWQNKT